MTIVNKTFSENLIRIRKQKGISQKELAEMTGISARMIYHYEKHVTNPPLEKIEIIAEALNVNISDLLGTDKKNKATDLSDFDVRTIKKIKKIQILNPHDRLAIYKMIDLLLKKDEYKDKLKEMDDNLKSTNP
jgi:transcriptional regulator with XRE-family HTH domain